MNLRTKPSRMGISSVLAVFALLSLAPTPTEAGLFKKIKKTAKKATSTVINEAEDLTELSSDEAKALTETAKKSYATTIKEGEAAYRMTVASVQAGIDAAKEAALRAAAEAYIKKYSGFLKKLRSNLDALAKDDSAVAVVDRLTKAATEKRLDDQTRADLLFIGERLGLLEWKPNSIVPGSSGGAMKSSWGLAVTGGGAYVGGIEGSVGLVANCYQEADRRYGAGLALSLGRRARYCNGRLSERDVLLAARGCRRCRRGLCWLGRGGCVRADRRNARCAVERERRNERRFCRSTGLLSGLGWRRKSQSWGSTGRVYVRSRKVGEVAKAGSVRGSS